MDLTLQRVESNENGIFSHLLDDNNNNLIAYTLEHAYDSGNGNGGYDAKVSPGTYTCVRGQHRLAGMRLPFQTFEITGVMGHTNILFHSGNFNKDSEGCVLLGTEVNGAEVLNSRQAFAKFMNLQNGINEFKLTVK